MVSALVASPIRTRRRRLLARIWLGVAAAIVVSLAFGFVLTFGLRGHTFEAQGWTGGVRSVVAGGFVTWMVFWMAKAARRLAGEPRSAVHLVPGAYVHAEGSR